MQNLHLSTLNSCCSLALEAHHGDLCQPHPSTREDESRRVMNTVLMTALHSCLWPLQESSPKSMCFACKLGRPMRFSNMDMKPKSISLSLHVSDATAIIRSYCARCQVLAVQLWSVTEFSKQQYCPKCSNKGKLEVVYATNVPKSRKTRHKTCQP